MRRVGGTADGLGDGALSKHSDLFTILSMKFLHDIGGELVIGDGKEWDLAAAGDDGGEKELRLGGEQNKVGVGRRLFEGFEKGVAASGKHLFGIMDDKDFDGGFKGW